MEDTGKTLNILMALIMPHWTAKCQRTVGGMNAICRMVMASSLFVLLLETSSAPAQISTAAPARFHNASSLLEPYPFVTDGSGATRQDLFDTNAVRLIAMASGLTAADLATIEIAPSYHTNGVCLYQVGDSDKAFNILGKQLMAYADGLNEGHSKPFLFAALTNQSETSKLSDPDLRVIATNQPWLPVSWLKKGDSGTHTNKGGEIVSVTTSTTFVNGKVQTDSTTNMPSVDEIMRWVSYTAVDGSLAWRYIFEFDPSGQIASFRSERFDPIELDPKCKPLFQAVEAEVEAAMKSQGTSGKLGSVHQFWRIKKEKLKAKGIDWHSAGELNRDTNYD